MVEGVDDVGMIELGGGAVRKIEALVLLILALVNESANHDFGWVGGRLSAVHSVKVTGNGRAQPQAESRASLLLVFAPRVDMQSLPASIPLVCESKP